MIVRTGNQARPCSTSPTGRTRRRRARRSASRTLRTWGPAVLRDYRLVERHYADIDYEPGAVVYGVVYLIGPEQLARLDRFEGYPTIYRRHWVQVEFGNTLAKALVYEMTKETKVRRQGLAYPAGYRRLCAEGAQSHGLPDVFSRRRRGKAQVAARSLGSR